MGDCINMEDYINMNNNKINSPNDIYKLFRTKFCKKLNKLDFLRGFFLPIMLSIPSLLFGLFVIYNYHHFFLFIILYIFQVIMDIVYSKIIINKKIKEKAEKTIKETLKNNMLEFNYNTISILQSNIDNLYNPFFKNITFFSYGKEVLKYLIGLVMGIISSAIIPIIQDEIKTRIFYGNLEKHIIDFFNLSFLIINLFYCLYCCYLLVQCIFGNNILKNIYVETLNDISFKLKLEEYNKNDKEKVKKSENNVNKIKVKINYKKRKKIDNDRTLNTPIKQKISYSYYQKQNRLNNKNR